MGHCKLDCPDGELDSQQIAKAADFTNTVQNVFKAYHVTEA